MSSSTSSASAFFDQPTCWKSLPSATEGRTVSGRIGSYDLLEEIARGGMGIVYKAKDVRSERLVALKLMRADMSDPAATAERFRREVAAVERLTNPHIVPILEAGLHEGRPYLVMEYVEGGRLDLRLPSFLGDPRLAAATVAKVARAVQHAHDVGIVHRDLKPGNILLDAHGEPKVTDFGLAKLVAGDLDLTLTGETLGTPYYMAPEQVAGRHQVVGPPTDVWGLGVVLHGLVTGIKPFPMSDRHSLYQAIQHGEPLRARAVRPQLDTALEAILLRCLAKEPEQRYPSAAALADDLDRWLQAKPVEASSGYRLKALFRRASRRGRWWGVGGGLVAAGLTVAVLWARQGSHNPAPAEPTALSTESAALSTPPTQPAAAAVAAPVVLPGAELRLLDDGVAPRWHRWRVGFPHNLQSQPFALHSHGPVLLELIPQLPVRPRTLIQCELSTNLLDMGRAGFYFACQDVTASRGKEFLYCTLGILRSGAGHFVQLELHRDRPASAGNGEHYHVTGLLRQTLPRNPTATPKWGLLAVELVAEEIRVSHDGKPLGVLPLAILLQHAERYREFQPSLPPTTPLWYPQGGVGLFVQLGDARFRNLRVHQPN